MVGVGTAIVAMAVAVAVDAAQPVAPAETARPARRAGLQLEAVTVAEILAAAGMATARATLAAHRAAQPVRQPMRWITTIFNP